MSGFEVFQLYLSLKCHFTSSSYDYFKYNGKLKSATPFSFSNRKDKYCFERLSKKYTKDQLIDFIVSNFLEDNAKWTRDLLSDDSERIFKDYVKRKESITYNFKNEISKLFDNKTPETFNLIFKENTEGFLPEIVKQCLQRDISMETFIILDRNLHFLDRLKKYYEKDIRFMTFYTKIQKYKNFINIDNDKFVKILKEVVKEKVC